MDGLIKKLKNISQTKISDANNAELFLKTKEQNSYTM